MSDLYDRIGREVASPPSDKLDAMKFLASRVKELSEEIDEAESRVKALKQLRQEITHHKLPSIMDEAGVDNVTVEGKKFIRDLFIAGTWPKDQSASTRALEYLRELDAMEIVDTVLTAKFERNEYDLAKHCEEQIKDFCETSINVSVHHSRLKKFVKDRILAGEPIDPEILNTEPRTYVKMK